MADSRARKGKIQDEPGASCMSGSKRLKKQRMGHAERVQEAVPSGQNWNELSNKLRRNDINL